MDGRVGTAGATARPRLLAALVISSLIAPLVLILATRQLMPPQGWAVLLVVPAVLATGFRRPWFLAVVTVSVALATLVLLTAGDSGWPRALNGLATVVGAIAGSALVARRVQDATGRELIGLERLSVTDQLTGVWNRRGLAGRLQPVLQEAAGGPVGVLVVDVDDLKLTNDRWGHRAGDAALGTVARALRRAVGSVGSVARTGGDEFVAVIVGDPDLVAHRLQSELDRDDLAVRVSVGTAGWDESGTAGPGDLLALLEGADAALYRAKRAGGGQVVAGNRRDPVLADAAVGGTRLPEPSLPLPPPATMPLRRADRRVFAALGGWFMLVGTIAALIQTRTGLPQQASAPVTLAIGLTLTTMLIGLLLRGRGISAGITPALLLALAALSSIAVLTRNPPDSTVGAGTWTLPVLLAATYWSRRAQFALYAVWIATRVWQAVTLIDVSWVAVAMLAGQTLAVIVAGETMWLLRRRHQDVRLQRHLLACSDPLTGIGNRRGLKVVIDALCPPVDVAVLVVDLDGFKEFNDRHGHLAGDGVLRRVADLLRAWAPDGAFAARVGGDEFVLVVPGAPAADAGRRLRAHLTDAALPVRVTLGRASARIERAEQVWPLIELADSQLIAVRRERSGAEVSCGDGAGSSDPRE